MPIQTSASRGYVLFISGNKRHTKVLKLSAGLSDTSCGLSKRGKDTESDAGRGMEETLEFCFKEFAAGYILELHAMHCLK